MKAQRLIEKYKKLEGVWDAPGAETARKIFLQDLEQLDEPEKVKVSEEEAKFLETFNLNHRSGVTKALYHVSRVGWGYHLTDNNGIKLKDLSEEFWDFENRKRLIKAILDGYEVEKEKRYIVKMKGLNEDNSYLNYDSVDDEWYFTDAENGPAVGTHHTRKQLEEAGFGWVFDCEGIEIREVEE